MNSFNRTIVVSTLLLTIACSSMLAAAIARLDTGITQTLIFIAGLMSMGFLTSLSRVLDTGAPRIELQFSPKLARVAVDEAIPAEFEEIQERPAWDMSAQQLMADDPTLALAKVRIDIEREVRRLATEAALRSNRPLHVMLEELAKINVLSPPIYQALRDVLRPLNQAIHGLQVDRDQVQEVFNLGNDLSRYLSSIDARQAGVSGKTQQESSSI